MVNINFDGLIDNGIYTRYQKEFKTGQEKAVKPKVPTIKAKLNTTYQQSFAFIKVRHQLAEKKTELRVLKFVPLPPLFPQERGKKPFPKRERILKSF